MHTTCGKKNGKCLCLLPSSAAMTAAISLRAKISLELVAPFYFTISRNEKTTSGQHDIRVNHLLRL